MATVQGLCHWAAASSRIAPSRKTFATTLAAATAALRPYARNLLITEDEDDVAGRVAVLVVEPLEVVQVQEQDGDAALVLGAQGAVHAPAEQLPVGQAGQAVVVLDHFGFDQFRLAFDFERHPGGRAQRTDVAYLCRVMTFHFMA